MKKGLFAFGFVAAVLVVGAGFSRDWLPLNSLSAAGKSSIRIADPDFLAFALVRLAGHQEFYRREGISVDLIRTASGRDALELLADGKVDFACAAGTPLAAGLLDAQDFVILAGLSTVDGAHAIVAPRGRGIRSPLDLRGRTVAVAPRTSSEFFLDRYLDFHGIPQKTVKRVIADTKETFDFSLDRSVDAVCTFKPWHYESRNYVRLGGDGVYTWNAFLVTRRAMVQENPELVERVLRAVLDAESYAIAHRQNVPAEMAAEYKMDVRTFETVWNAMRFNVGLDHAMLRSLEDEARWALERRPPGSSGSSPDFLNAFYFSGLSAVRPEAVTIVHNGEPLP